MKTTLTATFVATVGHSGTAKAETHWDTELSGFGLLVYANGAKTFFVDFRLDGRRRRKSIGSYPMLTIFQARNRAKQVLGEIAGGKDPFSPRTTSPTLTEFFETYLERHAKQRKRSWQQDRRIFEGHVKTPLGKRHLEEITRAQVAALHAVVGREAPYQANRMLSLLSKLFNSAAAWGYVSEDHRNPAIRIERFHERTRDRWVSQAEMPKLLEAIAAEEDVFGRAALWLYLLLGVRKRELLSLRWEDIDFSTRSLTIRRTKQGRTHVLPLSESASSILGAIPRTRGCPWVFPGVCGRHRQDIRGPWERIRIKAELTDVRLHDLRRTVGSWLVQSGVSLYVVGSILGHSQPTTTQIYARLGMDPQREALEDLSKKIGIKTVDTPARSGRKGVRRRTPVSPT